MTDQMTTTFSRNYSLSKSKPFPANVAVVVGTGVRADRRD